MQSIHQHLAWMTADGKWCFGQMPGSWPSCWPDIFDQVIEVVQHAVRLREFRDDEPPTLHRWILLGSSRWKIAWKTLGSTRRSDGLPGLLLSSPEAHSATLCNRCPLPRSQTAQVGTPYQLGVASPTSRHASWSKPTSICWETPPNRMNPPRVGSKQHTRHETPTPECTWAIAATCWRSFQSVEKWI